VVRNTKHVGDLGERIAEAYLELKGYQILRRNLRCAGREIDLLVRRGSRLVAVEVKLRRTRRFGRAIEAIDQRKLARIRVALQGVLAGIKEPMRPQIDVVLIDLEQSHHMVVRHIEAVY